MKAALREHAMQSLAAMVVQRRAKQEKRSNEEVFREFRKSRTFAMLFDEKTALWMNGPDYISDEYDLELEKSAKKRII